MREGVPVCTRRRVRGGRGGGRREEERGLGTEVGGKRQGVGGGGKEHTMVREPQHVLLTPTALLSPPRRPREDKMA